jgi:hypothetical protein
MSVPFLFTFNFKFNNRFLILLLPKQVRIGGTSFNTPPDKWFRGVSPAAEAAGGGSLAFCVGFSGPL